jgi:hypothetical protein
MVEQSSTSFEHFEQKAPLSVGVILFQSSEQGFGIE